MLKDTFSDIPAMTAAIIASTYPGAASYVPLYRPKNTAPGPSIEQWASRDAVPYGNLVTRIQILDHVTKSFTQVSQTASSIDEEARISYEKAQFKMVAKAWEDLACAAKGHTSPCSLIPIHVDTRACLQIMLDKIDKNLSKLKKIPYTAGSEADKARDLRKTLDGFTPIALQKARHRLKTLSDLGRSGQSINPTDDGSGSSHTQGHSA